MISTPSTAAPQRPDEIGRHHQGDQRSGDAPGETRELGPAGQPDQHARGQRGQDESQQQAAQAKNGRHGATFLGTRVGPKVDPSQCALSRRTGMFPAAAWHAACQSFMR